MKKSQIAAQLYTVRDFLKTPSEIAVSLQKVKSIGYDAVQVSGLGPIDDKELAHILDEEGLICCATHEKGAEIISDPERVIERLNCLNCKYTAYPYPHREFPSSAAESIAMARELEEAAKVFEKSGKILTYHNHDIEYMKFDGKTMLDYFYDNAPHLQSELDTFWVQAGGANPCTWIKKLEHRIPLLHLKDFGTLNRKMTMMHIGGGNLEWEFIIPAAEEAGTEWFIVEQDYCLIDPFESLRLSLNYITENFLGCRRL